jgi:Macrocin-O-methyltransferase (TylF)
MASWRSSEIPRLLSQYNSFSEEELLDMDVYEFGVFNGDSMVELAGIFNNLNIKTNCFYGFDVFTGMPKETAEPIFQEAWDPDIMPDAFNALLRLNIDTPEGVAQSIQETVQSVFSSANNTTKVSIIAGLVEETMVTISGYKKALYVDFDLDIYSPTKYAFDYLAKNNLIVKGTLIGYDDWGGTPHKNFEHGESRAHKEVSDEYGIKMTKIYEGGQGDPHLQTVWIVDEVQK